MFGSVVSCCYKSDPKKIVDIQELFFEDCNAARPVDGGNGNVATTYLYFYRGGLRSFTNLTPCFLVTFMICLKLF